MKLFVHFVLSILVVNFVFAQAPAELVPLSQVTHTANFSGDWSDPNVWGGNLPTDDAHVHIPQGVSVLVDGLIEARIKTLRLDGKLSFKNDVNTELKVETLIGLMTSELEMGTPANPIESGVRAQMTFIDEGPLDLDWDYNQFSKGMVFMGAVSIYGFEKTAFTSLKIQPTAGASALTLDEVPLGWQVDDEIVITGTDPFNPSSDEKRRISSLSGNTIELDNPLILDHVAIANDLDVHVANLSRNVIFSSENASVSRRAHIMFMHTTQVEMHNARTFQLGRTNKRVQVDDWFFPNLAGTDAEAGPRTNIRGRYSIHFHRGGVSPTHTPAATVKGCVVEDDAGWGYVNHSSHVHFLDNVSYNVVGGAFQTEAGDEIGSFKRNIAIRTVNPDFPLLDPETAPVDIREDSQDFAFQGDAFWIHGGRVAVDDNIASGASGHGFIYWTEGLREADTGVDANVFLAENLPNGEHLPLGECNTWWAPLISFKGNTAYSCTKGFQSLYIHSTLFDDYEALSPEYYATVHSTLEDFVVWNVRNTAIDISHNEQVTYKNFRIENDYSLNPNAIGITTDFMSREHIYENVSVRGFEEGLRVPTRGNITVLGGVWSNEIDFIIEPVQIANMPYYTRDLRFECVEFEDSPYFSNTTNFDMRGYDYFDGIAVTNVEDIARQFTLPDRITIQTDQHGTGRLYYDEQDPSFIPINSDLIMEGSGTAYEDDIINKSNVELKNEYGLCFGGALLPSDAVEINGVSGGKLSPMDPLPMNFSACAYSADHFLNFVPDQFDDFDFFSCWANATSFTGGTVGAYDHESCSPTSTTSEVGEEENSILFHPNPTSGVFQVSGLSEDSRIIILDLQGRILQTLKTSNSIERIDLDSFPEGLFFVRILDSSNQQVAVGKILKGN